jgi:hypothetical protein
VGQYPIYTRGIRAKSDRLIAAPSEFREQIFTREFVCARVTGKCFGNYGKQVNFRDPGKDSGKLTRSQQGRVDAIISRILQAIYPSEQPVYVFHGLGSNEQLGLIDQGNGSSQHFPLWAVEIDGVPCGQSLPFRLGTHDGYEKVSKLLMQIVPRKSHLADSRHVWAEGRFGEPRTLAEYSPRHDMIPL